MSFDPSAAKIDSAFDDPFEDEPHISALQLVAFAILVIFLILIPNCCTTPIEKDKRE